MGKLNKPGVLLMVIILVTPLLATCGGQMTVEEHFEQGLEYMNKGNEYLQTSAQLAQEGEEDRAQTELDKAKAEYQKAIAEFEQVLEEEPDRVSALVNLGAAHYSVLESDKAIEYYEKALELEEDAGIHSNLAAVYVNSGRIDKGLEEYEKAIELDPNLAEAHFGMGVIFVMIAQNDRAIAAFEKFQELQQGQDPVASSQALEYLKQLRGE
jgi:tetratricopeptide (TPR) repeat protein